MTMTTMMMTKDSLTETEEMIIMKTQIEDGADF